MIGAMVNLCTGYVKQNNVIYIICMDNTIFLSKGGRLMSFPGIPDINPEINITREDAINLLLISIALEEISLADLIDAETKKVNCVVDKCHCCSTQEIKDINHSVNQTLKDIIKLQMLLQFKLENVMEITSCSTTTTCTSTTTTTTATKTCSTSSSTTTKSTTSTTSTTTRKKCLCSLNGKGYGSICNRCDPFDGGMAVLLASICNKCENKENLLSYCVYMEDITLSFNAFPESFIIECPKPCGPKKIIIKGIGLIVKKEICEPDISDIGGFVLTVCDVDSDYEAERFEMIISADSKEELNHNSGIINTLDTKLMIGLCRELFE
jgi:hypothetical protein